MTRKTQFASGITLALGLILGLVLYARQKQEPSPAPALTSESTPRAHSSTSRASSGPASSAYARPQLGKFKNNEPVDPRDWLENGPKEPLEPPELHVEAEPAPGEVPTNEPLEPRELRIEAEPAPGEVPTNAPLTPRELHVDEPDP